MKIINVIAFCLLFTGISLAVSHPPSRPSSFIVKQSAQDGYTPLMRAAESGQVNVVRALLKKGARVDEPYGPTALMLAASRGHLAAVKVLLAAGANPNVSVGTPHAGEMTVLMFGIMSRNLVLVQTLIKAGAKVNPQTEEGDAPLMMAVHSRHLGIIKTLLAAGANVNARRSNGYTALMIAADIFDPAPARVLIAAGADVNAKNKFGETALALARKQGHTDVVTVLKRAGAKG